MGLGSHEVVMLHDNTEVAYDWLNCVLQELQQAMDKLELNLNKSDQGVGLESKEEEFESPENLAMLRQRKVVLNVLSCDVDSHSGVL